MPQWGASLLMVWLVGIALERQGWIECPCSSSFIGVEVLGVVVVSWARSQRDEALLGWYLLAHAVTYREFSFFILTSAPSRLLKIFNGSIFHIKNSLSRVSSRTVRLVQFLRSLHFPLFAIYFQMYAQAASAIHCWATSRYVAFLYFACRQQTLVASVSELAASLAVHASGTSMLGIALRWFSLFWP